MPIAPRSRLAALASWLGPLRSAIDGAHGAPKRVAVLCRTEPQAAALRRALARAGGALGVEVLTANGLVTRAQPKRLPGVAKPEPPARPETPLTRRIGPEGARPGLEAELAAWARAFRLHRAAGEPLPDGSDVTGLAEVADSGWGADDLECAWVSALGGLAQKRRPDALQVDETLCLGFDGPADAASEWEREHWRQWLGDDATPLPPVTACERALLAALGARAIVDTAPPPPARLPAIQVTDPPAEARLAVLLLLRSGCEPSRALVLVPDEPTARRVRAAGRPNGLAMADAERVPFASHGLADVLREALPWFDGSPDPCVRASQLDRVLVSPWVGRHLPAPVRDELTSRIKALPGLELAADADPLHVSARRVTKVLEAARIDEAPLSVWSEGLARLGRGEGREPRGRDVGVWTRQAALVLRARLDRLVACVRSEPFSGATAVATGDDGARPLVPENLGMVGPAALDDERTTPPELPAAGTLGALRRFLVDCHLRVADDELGAALVRALGEAADRPATAGELRNALAGTADSGRVLDGVEVLTYDDYDGRPSELLVLLGVHDKGIARAPAPDPLLSEGTLAALGKPGGRSRVVFRMLQALRAAARAETALAVVSERDTQGRVVVPPIEMRLDFDAGRAWLRERVDLEPEAVKKASYGLALGALPESQERACLAIERVAAPDAQEPPAPSGDAVLAAWARQASAEWYRAGRGAMPPAAPAESTGALRTLADVLDGYAPLAPAWLGPYLGEVGVIDGVDPTVKADGTPAEWSVSSHFTALTNCLYRLFAENVLRVREREPIEDGLGARDVGTAVHAAFELADRSGEPGMPWRVGSNDKDEVVRVQAEAAERLRALADGTFEEARGTLGHVSDAIGAATDGQMARWRQHWGDYAATRVKNEETVRSQLAKAIKQRLESAPGRDELEDACLQACSNWKAKAARKTTVAWLNAALVEAALDRDLGSLPLEELRTLAGSSNTIPKNDAGPLPGIVQSQAFRDVVACVRVGMAALRVLDAPIRSVETELAFGADAVADPRGLSDAVTHAALSLADRQLHVRGKIDRALVIDGADGPTVQLLDYKTGRPVPRSALEKGVATLHLPQLPVYALVLQTLLDAGNGLASVPAGARVRALGYDFVKEAKAGGLVDDILVMDETLEGYRSTLDRLVAEALAGRWSILPLKDDEAGKKSWGYPKGPVSLRDAARFEALPEPPDLSDRSEDDGEHEGGDAEQAAGGGR